MDPVEDAKQLTVESILGISFTESDKKWLCMVLSRIFCLRGKLIPKNFWSHAATRKRFFRPSRREHAPSEKFCKYRVQDWLKSHFWTSVTFTDSLILSSNKISI